MAVSAPPTGPTGPVAPPRSRGFLDWVEWAGNKLPEPALLFVVLAMIVVALSAVGHALDWQVQPVKVQVVTTAQLDAGGEPVQVPVLDERGRPVVELVASGEPIAPKNLASADGVYWMLSSMLRNFVQLPSLPLLFVAMLGIGVAEKFGLFGALMRRLALVTPRRFLTPVVVFIGANAGVASDAGYVILPPLAAALYFAMGRHPVAGLAAAFAGVAGGFAAGSFPAGSDGALAGFAQDAARVVDPGYVVTILHNWYFKVGSAIVVMFAGWYVTDRIVEPRLQRGAPVGGGDANAVLNQMQLTGQERRGLNRALLARAAVIATALARIHVPGMPLHGDGQPTLANGRVLVQDVVTVAPAGTPPADGAEVYSRAPLVVAEGSGQGRLVESPGPRWSHVIVPMIFFAFVIPGFVYGRATGAIRSQQDFVDGLYHGIRSVVPVLVITFFMAQFVNYFTYTNLDRMLAYSGGVALASAELAIPLLLVLFVLVVIFGDFAISGMISKFGVFAPVFVPMFMLVGISPELTTAAYRIGDSVVNIISPLNPYLLIVLAVMMKYQPNAGLGSLIALMVPYTLVFTLVWTTFLVAWYWLGLPLGPGAPLYYVPGS
ncbi:MAG: AbgT family transporter [Pseudomonadota bacterium]